MKMFKYLFTCFVILIFISCDQNQKTKDSTGLFPIRQNGKRGYIDKTGKIVINPEFDDGGSFSEGLAWVNIGGKLNEHGGVKGGKYGYIDKTGNIVINPQFDVAGDFSDGLAIVSGGGSMALSIRLGRL